MPAATFYKHKWKASVWFHLVITLFSGVTVMPHVTHLTNAVFLRFSVFSLLLICLLLSLFWQVGWWKSGAAAGPPLDKSERASVRAEGQGQPRVNFRNGQTWQPDLHGEALAVAAVATGKVLPQALASADFNEDGMTDVAVSYRSADGSGSVVLLKGNVDAVYPNAPEAQARRAAGVPAEGPWLSSAQIWQTAAADFVGAGDFDADGHWDLVRLFL